MKRLVGSVVAGVLAVLAFGVPVGAGVPVWRLIKANGRFSNAPAPIWLNIASIASGGPGADGSGFTATIQFRPTRVKTILKLNIGLYVDCQDETAEAVEEFAYDARGRLIPGYFVTFTPLPDIIAGICDYGSRQTAAQAVATPVLRTVPAPGASARTVSCVVSGDDPNRRATATVSATNLSSARVEIRVTVGFFDVRSVRLGTDITYVDAVDPGQTANNDASYYLKPGEQISTCAVINVTT